MHIPQYESLRGIIGEIMRKPTSLATALIMLALLFAVVPLMPQLARANPDPWWDTDWEYRMLINITENSGSTLTNYQTPITIDTATFNYSKADASGDDIRFATDSTECDYWIETWNTGGTSTIWVEVPSLTASSTTTIYMYYGNPNASSESDGSAVFLIYDNFDDNSMDSAWSTVDADGTAGTSFSETSQTMQIDADGVDTWKPDYGDEYGGVYQSVSGDFIATVKVVSQENTDSMAKAGLMIKNDMTGAGSSLGYVFMVITPGRNYFFQWDSDDDGYLDMYTEVGTTTYPSHVKVVKSGTTFTGYYSTDGDSWNQVDQGTLSSANSTQDIGMSQSSHVSGTLGLVVFDDIIVRKYASSEPTVNLGQEESSTSWMDYFGGTAAISSLANVAVSDGDVVLNTTSLSQGLDPADFNQEYTFNHDNPAQEISGFTLSQAIDSVDELQIYVVTADAGYNAKIAIYGPQNTPPSGAPLRMYTVSFNLGSTGWVGAALDSGSPQTSIPAGNYWFAVIEDDYATSTATTKRDTTCSAGYDGCSWYRTTMFTWPNFPSPLPSLSHSSSGYYGVYRITYSWYNTLGELKSTAITPEILGSWGNFTASHGLPTGTDISYKILKASDDSTLCTINATQAAAGYDISSCAGSNSSIKLYAELSTTGSNTPTLHDWKVTWVANTPPTVDEPVVTSSMTPQSQAWVNVTITDNNKLSDLSTVEVVLFYDAAGYSDPGASPTPDTQTLAIMTWYASNNTFINQSGSPSTWSIDNSTSTHPALTGYTGDWKFSFQPGKVATENGTGGWFARVNATDSVSAVGSNHTTGIGSVMNYYGEIVVSTAQVDFGSVTLGDAFAANAQTATVKNIANGDYNETAKTDNGTTGVGTWDNTTAITVTLNSTPVGIPGAGEFSLAIDDSETLASSVNMSTTYQEINSTGVQTGEAGYPAGNHGLWLALGSEGIAPVRYSGTIYFQILNRA